MALGTPANEVQGTLSASFTRGTDTNIVLNSGEGANFPNSSQVVRLTDGDHWCLLKYSSVSTDTLVMASATDYALENNVSSGDETYTWPVGSTVELVTAADYLKELQEKGFTDLADTPSSYAGYAGYSPVVNSGESALEFAKRASITTSDMDIYVSTTGSDSTGDGSSGNPYATIQHAIDSLPDLIAHAVTIHVADGTYYELVSIRNKYLTSPSASLTLQGNSTTPSNCIISGATSSASTTPARKQCVLITDCTLVTINGFKLEYGGADVVGDGERANLYAANSGLVLKNLDVQHSDYTGVWLARCKATLGDGPGTSSNTVSITNNSNRVGLAIDNSYVKGGAITVSSNKYGISMMNNAYAYFQGTDSVDVEAANNTSYGIAVQMQAYGQFQYVEIGGNDYGVKAVYGGLCYVQYANITQGANSSYDLYAATNGALRHFSDDTTLTTSTDSGTGAVIFT